MVKRIGSLLLLTLFLTACSPSLSSPQAPPAEPSSIPAAASTTASPPTEPIPVSTTEVVPRPKIITTVSTPHIDQGPDGAFTDSPSYPQDCGYQWARQALPELSGQFQQSIELLQPGAQAYAFGYGENCVHADGTTTFLPMETDFNVTMPVGDLSDKAALGEWIVKAMQVIEDLPAGQIIGPRPGRVGIRFESNGESQDVSFYIDQYRALPAGLGSAEIYQTLKSLQ